MHPLPPATGRRDVIGGRRAGEFVLFLADTGLRRVGSAHHLGKTVEMVLPGGVSAGEPADPKGKRAELALTSCCLLQYMS